jgi:RNase H-like domain found in reverse transcriptase
LTSSKFTISISNQKNAIGYKKKWNT